jgi:hypothetical protein
MSIVGLDGPAEHKGSTIMQLTSRSGLRTEPTSSVALMVNSRETDDNPLFSDYTIIRIAEDGFFLILSTPSLGFGTHLIQNERSRASTKVSRSKEKELQLTTEMAIKGEKDALE